MAEESQGLQVQSFCAALEALYELGDISEQTSKRLTDSYLYLRRIEQYLQQFDDKQTQTLPSDELNQARLCYLLNKNSYQMVCDDINCQMSEIHKEFEIMIGSEQDQEQQVASQYELLWAKPVLR